MGFDMDFDHVRPIFSGLLGGLVVYLLIRSGRKPAPRDESRRVMTYGLGFRLFAAVLIPGSLFVAYAAAHARPSQTILAACIAAAFLVSAVFLAYQAFCVSFSYDDTHIYYKTPLAGHQVIPWSDVLEVGYSRAMQSYYLRTKQVRRIWCSSMLLGYEELGEFISERTDDVKGKKVSGTIV